MARPTVDREIRPWPLRVEIARRRLAVLRSSLNVSVITRIDRIIREKTPLSKVTGHLAGDIQTTLRNAERGDVEGVKSLVFGFVVEGLAILACYDEC